MNIILRDIEVIIKLNGALFEMQNMLNFSNVVYGTFRWYLNLTFKKDQIMGKE